MKKITSKVHPDLQQAAQKSPTFTYNKSNIWLIRLLVYLMPPPKISKDIQIKNVWIHDQDNRNQIRLRIYQSESNGTATPALLWLHGGGYVMGKPEMDDLVCAQYVREAGITVVSVDYRYAPEHPFPTGLEDGYLALNWIASHAQQLGIDTKRIAVGGQSAGGGLAAALVQMAFDRKEVLPIFQLLVYPMLDDRTVVRTDIDQNDLLVWSCESNRFGWESYLGTKCGEQDVRSYSVPARRENLLGLPPAWIGVGTLDLFYEENAAYAKNLQRCGVEHEIYIVPGAFHGFDVIEPLLPVVQEFRKSQISALKKHLFP